MGRLTGRRKEQGVTLVELMIVVAILGMVMAAMYNMFEFQQRSYTTQDNVAVMQQNVRVGLEYMVKGIRMAGYIPESIPYDPSDPPEIIPGGTVPANDNVPAPPPPYTPDGVSESIEEATANTITFQADIDNDGRTETVRYALNGADLTWEVWEWNGGWGASGGQQIVADNIESITFTYTGVMPNGQDEDGDGIVDNDGELCVWDIDNGVDDDNDGNVDEDGALNTTNLREDIRQIRLTMTARAPNQDSNYTHPTQGDHYRRRTLSSNISLRNMR